MAQTEAKPGLEGSCSTGGQRLPTWKVANGNRRGSIPRRERSCTSSHGQDGQWKIEEGYP